MNGSVRDAAFSSDGNTLYTIGGDGRVWIWDMATRRCRHQHIDVGTLHGTAISVSKDGRYYSTG
jgi:WD40 repeat protein